MEGGEIEMTEDSVLEGGSGDEDDLDDLNPKQIGKKLP